MSGGGQSRHEQLEIKVQDQHEAAPVKKTSSSEIPCSDSGVEQ